MTLAVLYTWKITSGKEKDFEKHWLESTQIIYQYYGSLGSSLHKQPDGTYLAYARWKNKADWQKMADAYEATLEIETFWKNNVQEIKQPQWLELTVDFLQIK